MPNATFRIPTPVNDPVLGYGPATPERDRLQAELKRQSSMVVDIPLFIGGEEIRTGRTQDVVMPHDHGHVIATCHLAGPKEIDMAVDASLDAHRMWSSMDWASRAAIFLKAADLLVGPWRQVFNAATMLNQSKTCHQAEIDASCELVDFFRFNASYVERIYRDEQPPVSPPGVWNQLEFRALEGFIYSVTPFNFTSIAVNLPAAPAIMGNVGIWKPSAHCLLSNWYGMQLLHAAGLPAGVINFLPGDAEEITNRVMSHSALAGLHFTGSTEIFRHLWRQMGERLETYRNYPRIVGETGGKDFVVAHPSADADAVRTALIRGSFEFQGQKCSASSRAYVPRSMWATMKDELVGRVEGITVGNPADFSNYMGAVIHEAAFDRCRGYIERAEASDDAEVIVGGGCDSSTGWFVEPTIIVAKTPDYESMQEEIFGPILTVYVYDDADWDQMLDLVDETSPYALTGAIFARERTVIDEVRDRLRYAAGNFYINDKPTGAVVGQQPFGGGRASGTNDKAGSALNLIRWTSPRTIKETLVPPTSYRYPFMNES